MLASRNLIGSLAFSTRKPKKSVESDQTLSRFRVGSGDDPPSTWERT